VENRFIWLTLAVLGYGAANYLSGKNFMPGCSFAELRPQICLPIFIGIYFGPLYGFVSGAFGDSFGYILNGSNPFLLWHWALANGLVGFIPGCAHWLKVRRIETLKELQFMYGLLLLSTTLPFFFSCGMEWFLGHMPLKGAVMLLFLPIAVTDALFAIMLIPLCLIAARLLVFSLPIITFLLTSYLTGVVVLITFTASLFASFGSDALAEMAPANLYTLGVVLLLVVTSGFALSAYFAKRITGPITILTKISDHIAVEEYDHGVSLKKMKKRSDELGRLANAFDLMLQKIQQREENLKSEVRKLHIEIDKKSSVTKFLESLGASILKI